ncbi:hypothetical protein [Arenibacter certesii]|uniref:Sulfur reduction protein DsrE n=1 Tax=Arenibacter certesii TaxID=228955 RepID=A0A918J1G0_9FLAO|nr:hypothetical protein [Arenibacter certesii]GGW42575.1 hypothetical protein GCM10007383_28950 [Arenibacter certesii]
MKIKTLLILAGAFLMLPFQMKAQNTAPNVNYTALVKNSNSLTGVIETAEELMIANPNNFGEFQIVFCGKSIHQITDAQIMNPILNRIDSKPIKIVACGFSLNKFKVDRSKVPQGIQTVENGILHQLQLLKKGYLNLDL